MEAHDFLTKKILVEHEVKQTLESRTGNFATKPKAEVLREFDSEKWAEVLAKASEFRGFSLLDGLLLDFAGLSLDSRIDFWQRPHFNKVNLATGLLRELTIMIETLRSASLANNQFTEIGSGFGYRILTLAEVLASEGIPAKYTAIDLSANGLAAAELFAERSEINLATVRFDVEGQEQIDENLASPGGVWFSFCALHYASLPPHRLARRLARLPFETLVAFEPIHKAANSKDEIQLDLNQYIEMNSYYPFVLEALTELARIRHLRMTVDSNCFGLNPKMPLSIITLQQ